MENQTTPQIAGSKQLVLITPERLLRVYNPKNCLKHSGKVKSIKDAISLDSPKLLDIQRTQGKLYLISFLSTWLLYLNEILDLKKPLSEEEIDITAELISDEYYMLKISDITLIFKNALSGKYGEFYENLSAPKIISWFSDYFDKRCEVGEYISNQESNKIHSNSPLAKWDNEVIKEMFKNTSEQLKEPEKITLEQELYSSENYIKSLNQIAKNLSINQIKDIISKWEKYPSKKMYQDVLEKEIKSRATKNT